MFEIRVICDPDDTDRIGQALATVFAIGPARQYPTRDGKRTRLYVTADHRSAPGRTPGTGLSWQEAADRLDAHCEQRGVFGVGDVLRRIADA